jgi:hypothetical protein
MTTRTKKISTGLGLSLMFIGLLLLSLFEKSFNNVIIISSIIFIGFFILLYIYLQTGFDFLIPKPDNRIEIEGHQNIVYQIQGNLDTISPEILRMLKEGHPDSKYFEIIEYTYQFRNRLKSHIENISRNGNLNLLIGLLITAVAICLLLYIVFEKKEANNNYFSLLSHYIPRVLITFFVEIFAFFFLKLYKTNVDEVRYFQNELTNIDSKIIGLKTAIWSGEKDALNIVIQGFKDTERNFILKKDEKTIELEKIKIDSRNSENLTSNLLKTIEGIVGKKNENSANK